MTGDAGLLLQPYMLERHPAYRAQLDILRDLAPTVRINPVRPPDTVEHERWAPQQPWVRRMRLHWPIRARSRGDVVCHYFVGDFPPEMHSLLRAGRVHLDADDPLNLYKGVSRSRIDGEHCRRVALALGEAMRAGSLTLTFWSEISLKTFAAALTPVESTPLIASGRLGIMPPWIRPHHAMARVGADRSLRCLMIASGKFWHKGVGDAIAAVYRAAADGHDVRLTLVSAGMPARWQEFVNRSPRFRVYGRLSRPDIDNLILEHDILVFPSHHNTYGWVIVEAKARGLPAIATDFYTRPEIVTHEHDGLLVAEPFGNPFLPIAPVAYAAGFLEPDDRGGIAVSPLLEPYIDALTAAIIRCCRNRDFLRAMGEHAYEATAPAGRFGHTRRLASLRRILLRAE